MAETLTFRGRLPGVVCEMALPPQPEAPLRLDVAAFVGFAERGPLNTPMMLEDSGQYAALFGGDLAIARQKGNPVYANLPRAVAAFFDNGGRRCYVVRVAGEAARPNRFRLPGLVTWGSATHATIAQAAWVGRWSDTMSVSTQLRSTPLKMGAGPTPFSRLLQLIDGQPALSAKLHLEVPARNSVKAGDLLCLSFGSPAAPDYLLYFPVTNVALPVQPASTQRGIALTVSTRAALLFEVIKTPSAAMPSAIERLGEASWEPVPAVFWGLIPYDQRGVQPLEGRPDEFSLNLPQGSKVESADLLRLSYGPLAAPVLLPIKEIAQVAFPANPQPDAPVELYPQAIAQRPRREVEAASAMAALGTLQPTQVDLLRFDLKIREGDQTLEVWSEVGFGDDASGWRQRLASLADDSPPASLDALAGRSLRLRAPAGAGLFLPLSMSDFGSFAAPLADNSKLAKDGLDSFEPQSLFLDSQLAGFGVNTLVNEADNILYLRQPPGKLAKLHSLHAIDEIGLIAIPDLVHLGFPGAEEPSVPAPEPMVDGQDYSCFDDCCQPQDETPVPASVPQTIADLPTLVDAQEYDPSGLLAVQRALILFCAARADRMAILSLPHHFGQREALEWQAQIAQFEAAYEGTLLSYAAVYHPWLEIREDHTPQLAPLRALPPEGAVCGMIAARERVRGPWIAPANEALRGVVRLDPPLTTQDWEALFNRQINLVRQQPGRFTLLSAHTLSSDRLLLQISVRRLLIYLRKLALLRGEKYVFENNSPSFRRSVQISFERTLTTLAQRGALVAFEVNTGREYNTENDEYNGRLIIAIKVAPTNPIEFITVVLLRSGDTLLEVLER